MNGNAKNVLLISNNRINNEIEKNYHTTVTEYIQYTCIPNVLSLYMQTIYIKKKNHLKIELRIFCVVIVY